MIVSCIALALLCSIAGGCFGASIQKSSGDQEWQAKLQAAIDRLDRIDEDCEVHCNQGAVMSKKLRKKLDKAINEFLKEYRESERGGYAEVTWDDFNLLRDVTNILVRLKCQADVDGDRPMSVHFINRRVNTPNHYRDVPYDHLTPSKEVLEALLSNMRTASSQLDTFLRCFTADQITED